MSNARKQETLEKANQTYHPYRTITSYTCSLTIPDDETTQVIIITRSAGVCYASSPDDALKQMECDKQYSKQSYASHILRYVADNLTEIDLDEVELTFIEEPIVSPMTNDELADFQRDVVSLNGF